MSKRTRDSLWKTALDFSTEQGFIWEHKNVEENLCQQKPLLGGQKKLAEFFLEQSYSKISRVEQASNSY